MARKPTGELRVQIELHQAIRDAAKRAGVPMTEILRRSLALYVMEGWK